MVNCPKCAADVETPLKTWPIPSRRPPGEGEELRLTGIFECPNCSARFRAAVTTKERSAKTSDIKNIVDGIRCIKSELTQTLVNLRQKIKTLENERVNLMVEIEDLKKVAQTRVNALEDEVAMLKNDAKFLRDLLGHR